jgi:uncharacterized membrane protein (DUF2068 family)
MALFSLMNFPGPWWYSIPEAEETPMFVIYVGIVLSIVGIVAAVGLWVMKRWGFWATIIVSVLNILLNVSGLAMVPTSALLVAIAVQTVGFILTIVLVVLQRARRTLTAS